MKFPISYDSQSMTLTFQWGKHYKFLQCPFATWWKARKYFKRPKFKFYFGPMWKSKGEVNTDFGNYDDYEYLGGYWPAVSTEWLNWSLSDNKYIRFFQKLIPITIQSSDICWKDKYDTPRYERVGYFIIFFGRSYRRHWQFSMTVSAPEFFCNNDCTIIDHAENYWESILWYLHYADRYNSLNHKKDIFKARNSMMQNHWSSSNPYDVEKFNIVNVGHEVLYMGCDDIKDFVFIDVLSDELYDKLEIENPTSNLQSYDNDKYIYLVLYSKEDSGDKSKFKMEFSKYIKLINDEENDKRQVRIYFKYFEWLLNTLKNKEYSSLEITVSKHIDCGPAFKDDFLNKNGINLIRKIYGKLYNKG